ncbi:hypothetical protein KAJ38_02830 [Candidatus Pacearchaeota archaeon]|nr:hypothetical protein [Candidatus Pacearchaeota archaeon]
MVEHENLEKKEEMKKKQNLPIWVWILISVLVILLLMNYNTTKELKKEVEYSKNCIDDCIFKFDGCLDNITKPTFPSNPKILDCLWDENWCVENCQIYDYEYQKAMGRIE